MYCQVWWSILEIGALHLTHPSAHTHCEHAPGAVGSHYSSARGAIGGSVPCSRAPQSWYWRWRECCSFTIPTFNPCRTWDSNPQPLDYKSDSLTIRPRLPSSTKRVSHRGSLLKGVAVYRVLYQSILNAKLTGRKNLGRKRCTSNRDDCKLENTVKQSWFKQLWELHKEWTEAGVSASRVTTLRRLQEKGYQATSEPETTSEASYLGCREKELDCCSVVQSPLFRWK